MLYRTLTVAVALAAAATAAAAAPRRTTARAAAVPGPDVYAGYSHTSAGDASLSGWALSGAHPLGRGPGDLRLVLELTGHYGSYAAADLSQSALFGGVRNVWSWRALNPFVEGLVGVARTSVSAGGISAADSDAGVALGGGVDYPFSPAWAARGLVQLRLLHGEGAWDSDPRFSLGVVYRFGR